jgi:hypothetical protein
MLRVMAETVAILPANGLSIERKKLVPMVWKLLSHDCGDM